MQAGDVHLAVLPLGELGMVEHFWIDPDPPGGFYPEFLCKPVHRREDGMTAAPGGSRPLGDPGKADIPEPAGILNPREDCVVACVGDPEGPSLRSSAPEPSDPAIVSVTQYSTVSRRMAAALVRSSFSTGVPGTTPKQSLYRPGKSWFSTPGPIIANFNGVKDLLPRSRLAERALGGPEEDEGHAPRFEEEDVAPVDGTDLSALAPGCRYGNRPAVILLSALKSSGRGLRELLPGCGPMAVFTAASYSGSLRHLRQLPDRCSTGLSPFPQQGYS